MTVQGANRRDVGLLAELIGVSLGAVLASLSAVRRGKVVHPDGVVHDARLIVPGEAAAPRAARLLSQPGEHRAVVRFSRSLGLPRPLPDLLGLSVRVLDPYGPGCHQDFLLVSSADLPILHHLFLPARDVQQRPFTSSLPYRAGGETFLVGALPDHGSPLRSGGDEFDRLEAAAATKQLRFHLAVASAWGRFRPVAELGVGRRLPAELDALRFNPWNTGGGLEPAGALNRARDRAYRMSQATWRRTRRDGAQLQDAADRRLAALSSASGPR